MGTPQSSAPNADFNNARVRANVQPLPGHQRHATVDAEDDDPGHQHISSSFLAIPMSDLRPQSPLSLHTPEHFRRLTVQTSWGPEDNMAADAPRWQSHTMPADAGHRPSHTMPADPRHQLSHTMPADPRLRPPDDLPSFHNNTSRQRHMSEQLRALPSAQ